MQQLFVDGSFVVIKHSLTNAPASVKTFPPLDNNSVGNDVTMFRVRVEAASNIIDEGVARIHAVFFLVIALFDATKKTSITVLVLGVNRFHETTVLSILARLQHQVFLLQWRTCLYVL